MQYLLNAATANGAGPVCGGNAMASYPNKGVQVVGTFDGATVTITVSLDGVNFGSALDGDDVALTFTAAGTQRLDGQWFVKATITNAGAATNLTAMLG